MSESKENKKYHPYKPTDVDPINCIICDSEITLLHPGYTENYKIESQMWNGGIVSNISAGYGSDYDGNVFLIGICDKCIKKSINNGKIIFLYDYMNVSQDSDYYKLKEYKEDYNKFLREEYNKNLHRKMKLKRILKNGN